MTSINAFDSGFDVMPEISHEEALTAEVDEMLGEVADLFDEVAEDLTGFVDSQLTQATIGVTQIRNTLDGLIAAELTEAGRLQDVVVKRVTDVVDEELSNVVDVLRLGIGSDPFGDVGFPGGQLPPPSPDLTEPPPRSGAGGVCTAIQPEMVQGFVPMPRGTEFGGTNSGNMEQWNLSADLVPPFGSRCRWMWRNCGNTDYNLNLIVMTVDPSFGEDTGIPNPFLHAEAFGEPICPAGRAPEEPAPPIPIPQPGPEPPKPPEPEPEEPKGGCDDPIHIKICPPDVGVFVDCESNLLIVSKLDEANPDWTSVQAEGESGIELDELVRLCSPEEPVTTEEGLPDFIELLKGIRDGCVLPDAGVMDAAGIEAMLDAIRGIQKPAAGLTILETILKLMGKNTTGWGLPLLIITTLMLVGVKEARAIWKQTCGDDDLTMRAVFTRSVSAFLDRLLPGAFAEQMGRQSQIINNQCPWQIPEVDQAIAAWRSGWIDTNTRDCYIRANGFRSDLMKPYADSTQAFPTVFEAAMAVRRGLIDRDVFDTVTQRVGFKDLGHANMLFDLTEQIPPPTDLIRYMVRDADDPLVVQRFNLDSLFDDKFPAGGQVRKWAASQGVTEEQMRYSWRSHWTIPSPSQLFTIFHRTGRNPDGSPIAVVQEDVRQALIQQDILPFWIPKLTAASFRLPTQRQIGRAFRVGVFSEADVLFAYVKLGYETQTAQAFTRFTLLEARRILLSSTFVKAYSRGEINAIELRKVLGERGATKDAINDAVDRGGLLAKITSKKACLAAVKHKVMLGEITQNEAAIEVFDLTDQSPIAQNLVTQWFCERDSKSKTATASQLCAFFTDGLIDASEFQTRLIRIGIQPETATDMVQRCILQLQRRIRKAELARLKADAAAASRAVNQAKREETKRLGDEAKTVRARIASRKAREARQRELLSAAKTLSNKIGVKVEDVFVVVSRTHNLIVQRGIATAEKSAQDAKDLASAGSVLNLEDWQDALLDVLVSGPVA